MAALPIPELQLGKTGLLPSGSVSGVGATQNRKIDDLLGAAGFQIVELKTCYLPGTAPDDVHVPGIRAGVSAETDISTAVLPFYREYIYPLQPPVEGASKTPH
jgi:hypothetical protein